MAKQSNGKVGASRIRLVVFEADVADGSDLSQITQAIQNALRPQQIVQQRIINQASSGSPLISARAVEDTEPDPIVDEAQEVDEPVQTRKPREPRTRRTVVPRTIEMQPEAVDSWKNFAASKNSDSDLGRTLLVAAWHSEYQGNEPITPSHVYTCYRYMKWPVGMSDFGAPLRKLKQQQRLNSAGRAAYTITQMGLQDVNDMEDSAE